ncbi:MAG: hypothetical protein AB1540_14850 [Bdellovibrionota bacterium]
MVIFSSVKRRFVFAFLCVALSMSAFASEEDEFSICDRLEEKLASDNKDFFLSLQAERKELLEKTRKQLALSYSALVGLSNSILSDEGVSRNYLVDYQELVAQAQHNLHERYSQTFLDHLKIKLEQFIRNHKPLVLAEVGPAIARALDAKTFDGAASAGKGYDWSCQFDGKTCPTLFSLPQSTVLSSVEDFTAQSGQHWLNLGGSATGEILIGPLSRNALAYELIKEPRIEYPNVKELHVKFIDGEMEFVLVSEIVVEPARKLGRVSTFEVQARLPLNWKAGQYRAPDRPMFKTAFVLNALKSRPELSAEELEKELLLKLPSAVEREQFLSYEIVAAVTQVCLGAPEEDSPGSEEESNASPESDDQTTDTSTTGGAQYPSAFPDEIPCLGDECLLELRK